MIALAESVSHGCNTLRYITGETPNKDKPERVFHIYNNLMPDGLDARDMWDSFKITLADNGKANGRLKNSVISFVISPSPEEARKLNTDEDWKKLGLEYLAIFDSLILRDEKGNVYSEPTNILGSKFTMWEHEDSESGVHHLHIAALRIDMDGNMNNDHQILVRAQRAAAIHDRRHNRMTAKEVREDHLIDVEYNCDHILRNMPVFNIDAYFDALRSLKEGYTVETKRDSNNNYVRYVICDGNKRYTASSIGKNRKFTVAHLEETWKKLRADELKRLQTLKEADEKRMAASLQAERKQSDNKVENNSKAPVQKPCTHSKTQSQQTQSTFAKHDYTHRKPNTTYYDYTERGKTTRYYLPTEVMDFFESEFDYQTILNRDDLIHMSVGLFVEVVLSPEVQPTVGNGGGGGNNDLPRRKDDEDDMAWARRCARYAASKIKMQPKRGMRR